MDEGFHNLRWMRYYVKYRNATKIGTIATVESISCKVFALSVSPCLYYSSPFHFSYLNLRERLCCFSARLNAVVFIRLVSVRACVSCICRCQHGATNPDGPDKARRLGIALRVIFWKEVTWSLTLCIWFPSSRWEKTKHNRTTKRMERTLTRWMKGALTMRAKRFEES